MAKFVRGHPSVPAYINKDHIVSVYVFYDSGVSKYKINSTYFDDNSQLIDYTLHGDWATEAEASNALEKVFDTINPADY